jgi:hypothetical protein
MKPRWLYYIAGVLLTLFAIGHQLGFRHVDPAWHANDVVASMQQTHFTVQGFDRTYWSFFSGFGFFSTAFLLFSALLAFELGRLRDDTRAQLATMRWAFALCFVAITLLMWANFFATPVMFATLITLCLLLAARQTGTSS